MREKTLLEETVDRAREHEPFGEPNSLGFETRLRAAMSEIVPSEFEILGRLSWRFSLACLPVILVASVVAGLQSPGFLPEGLGGVVSQWSVMIPVDLF